MQWTNRFNIPLPIVKAVQRDTYNPGNSDVSVTRLILPPKIAVLQHTYAIVELCAKLPAFAGDTYAGRTVF